MSMAAMTFASSSLAASRSSCPLVASRPAPRVRASQRCRSSAGPALTTAYTTKVARNKNIAKLQAGYLFPEIARRRRAHQEKHPDAKLISLGIGDTTEPLTPTIVKGLADAAVALGTLEGYSGYGAEQGQGPLREAIRRRIYGHTGISTEEVFVSDGSKCDIGRLQVMFGSDVSVAVQDPAYPVYVDSSVIVGSTGTHNGTGFDGITYLPCLAENGFFPDLSSTPRTDVIFFCSPNNPTGAAATRAQLAELVAFAKKNGSIIVYDAAYALYVDDPDRPKTIYEVPGAEDVAIETCSLSKYAGFTGVRLGWTVVPEALKFADGSSVAKDWVRIMTTIFNGASNIAQAGALAALSDAGWAEMAGLVAYYKQNARVLKATFQSLGLEAFGGDDAPYVWVRFPGRKSWDVFADVLERCHVVVTPGSGFGGGGEGYIRASAFGHHDDVLEAARRIKEAFGANE